MKWLAKHLSKFGAVGSILAALCCLGFSALVAIFGAVGLGFLINDAILLPALLVFLTAYVVGLALGWRIHRAWWIPTAGVISAVATFGFIFVWFQLVVAYLGIAALVAIAVIDVVFRYRAHHQGEADQSQDPSR